ncbi:sensor histidine kinase [Aquimarina sediminis]|uniref:sensor histidine kinase n=1 Tax=Aquimarina sediminis TaxID=2070536 RepID=UPI000CA0384F|nr:histidine kinase [Aquimarina sediminis]
MITTIFLKNRILKHISFWFLYLLMWVLLDVLYGVSLANASYKYLGCLLEIPLYYLHMYYLWPKYIGSKRYLYYFLTFTPLLVLNSLLVLVFQYYFVYPILIEVPNLPPDYFSIPRILSFARSILLWFGPPTAIKILHDHYENKVNLEKIQKEKKISELNFLRSQINPHFLFNTLNNLYSLSLKGSKKTPDALLQLSNLLSYTLYEGSEDNIPLEKEIKHLHDYIELERLRFGNRLNLLMEMTGNFNEVMITPLILIPIVENAFKHCSLNERGNVKIQIKIAFQDGELHISTVNPVGNSKDESDRNGIGVQNLSKRLQIIYPQKHIFRLEERSNKFYVDLKIQLRD